MQLAALGVTLLMASVSGAFCGWLVSNFDAPNLFDDREHFFELEIHEPAPYQEEVELVVLREPKATDDFKF